MVEGFGQVMLGTGWLYVYNRKYKQEIKSRKNKHVPIMPLLIGNNRGGYRRQVMLG